LAIGTNRGIVQIWDVAKSKKLRDLSGHGGRVGTLAWNDHILTCALFYFCSPHHSSGGRDRFIFHRDVRCQDPYIKKLAGHKQEVCGLKWNPEGTQLASGGNDNRLLIWDRNGDSPLYKFAEHTAAVKALAWSPHQVRLEFYFKIFTSSAACSYLAVEQRIARFVFGTRASALRCSTSTPDHRYVSRIAFRQIMADLQSRLVKDVE
jgi:WD40 repeat protein